MLYLQRKASESISLFFKRVTLSNEHKHINVCSNFLFFSPFVASLPILSLAGQGRNVPQTIHLLPHQSDPHSNQT